MVVLNNVVMSSKNLLGLKDLAGLPLLSLGLPTTYLGTVYITFLFIFS